MYQPIKERCEALVKNFKEIPAERKELLEKLRADDLADVLAKCELHGFTLTDVKKSLRTKGAKKATPRKSAPRKTAARKSTPRKKAA